MARGFKTGGRPPGKRNKRTEVRLEAIKVLLRDGSRQPLDVVLHSMNVEFEQAERAAAFEKAKALASTDQAVQERAELIVPDYSQAVDNAVACLPYLHPKLSNVTIEEDKASPEEVSRRRSTQSSASSMQLLQKRL